MGKLRALVVAACCLLVTGLLPAQQAAAYDVQVQDSTAGRSRTYTAYNDDNGTIFELKFSTLLPGEKRRIRANIVFSMPKASSDPMVVARHAIRCGKVGSEEYEELFGVRNILRGQTYTQKPRYTFTADLPGQYRCWLWVGTGRPRPSGTRTKSNILKVGWGSYIQATEPIRPASDHHFTPEKPSRLVLRGKQTDENVLTWTAPLLTSKFSASGDAYVTTCTSVGGSYDPVTLKHLCTGHTKIYGTRITTRLVVGQLRADGKGYCALHYFPSKTGRKTYITRDIHHVVVFNSGTVPVRTGNGCGRTFRAKVMVRNVEGAAAMVHRQGTITAVIPPA